MELEMEAKLMKVIAPHEVEALLETDKNVTMIDVREAFEIRRGMIPGAIHISLGKLQNSLDKLEQSKHYIIVCETGSRSGVATYLLNSLGYNASNLIGGMVDWKGPLRK